MADPVSSTIVSAITKGVVDRAWSSIVNSDNPEETWKGSAETCVVQARSSISNYDTKLGQNYEQMKSEIGQIGNSAQQLAERGKIKDFDERLINLLHEFSRSCLEYANSPSENTYQFEEKFISELDDLGERIIEITTDT